MMKTFEIETSGVATIGSFTMKKVLISFDAEPSDIAEKLTAEEVVSALGSDAILAAIGEDKAKIHFGLVDSSEIAEKLRELCLDNPTTAPEAYLLQEMTKLADSLA